MAISAPYAINKDVIRRLKTDRFILTLDFFDKTGGTDDAPVLEPKNVSAWPLKLQVTDSSGVEMSVWDSASYSRPQTNRIQIDKPKPADVGLVNAQQYYLRLYQDLPQGQQTIAVYTLYIDARITADYAVGPMAAETLQVIYNPAGSVISDIVQDVSAFEARIAALENTAAGQVLFRTVASLAAAKAEASGNLLKIFRIAGTPKSYYIYDPNDPDGGVGNLPVIPEA